MTATSAVDTATDAKIRKAFAEEIPGTTKLIIAQRISSVPGCRHVLLLWMMVRLMDFGTHEESDCKQSRSIVMYMNHRQVAAAVTLMKKEE